MRSLCEICGTHTTATACSDPANATTADSRYVALILTVFLGGLVVAAVVQGWLG